MSCSEPVTDEEGRPNPGAWGRDVPSQRPPCSLLLASRGRSGAVVLAQRGRRAVPGLPGKRLRAGGLPGVCICDSGLEVPEGWTFEVVGGVWGGLAQVRKG